jgi:hypothetical protein
MIGGLNVSINDAAEESMDHEPALDVVPDPGKGRIELLSTLFIFHSALSSRPSSRHRSGQARLQFYCS